MVEAKKWALILGASSGFGEAVGVELASIGYNVYGVHLDRRETLPHAEAVQQKIRAAGREAVFFNMNAADDEKRAEVIQKIKADGSDIGVLLHSLAFGALRPLAGAAEVATKRQIEMTSDVMGHSLVYWANDLVSNGLMKSGGRIYAMTSEGAGQSDSGVWSGLRGQSHSRISYPAARARACAVRNHSERDHGRRDRHARAAQDTGLRKADGVREGSKPASPADHACRCGALDRGAVQSRRRILDDRQHGASGWRGRIGGMSLPGLTTLEATPEILRLLMDGLSEEDAKWKPGPHRFSVAETLEHLSHVEGHCFRARVESMVTETNPSLEPYDADAYFTAGQYSGRDPEDSFDHFEEQRELNLEYLHGLRRQRPRSGLGRRTQGSAPSRCRMA